MEFEWDEDKRLANIEKHGFDFLKITSLFNDQPTLTTQSIRNDELRWKTVGIYDGQFVTIIWTPREGKTRIISARKARDEEREHYCQLYDG